MSHPNKTDRNLKSSHRRLAANIPSNIPSAAFMSTSAFAQSAQLWTLGLEASIAMLESARQFADTSRGVFRAQQDAALALMGGGPLAPPYGADMLEPMLNATRAVEDMGVAAINAQKSLLAAMIQHAPPH